MYRLFEVTGIELEYAVIDERLRPRCVVADAFRTLAGRGVSDVERGRVGFSNELAAHVFEIKTTRPERSLRAAEAALVAGVRFFAALLAERFGARLLPGGMHPFMAPEDTTLWPRAGRRIYETYARIFDINEHGWLNVQSCHVNLPFATEVETAALHNAVACLLPYLPALAASSPVYEGRLGPHVDNRLAFYQANQRRIPQITGSVIPEFMRSYAEYRREVLEPIYRALARIPGGERLCHEWVNSRGAILRFDRRALEIRLLDMQECVKMDIAAAAFTRGVLAWMVRQLQDGAMALPPHETLVRDLDAVIRDGGDARVEAPHLPGPGRRRGQPTARAVLRAVLEEAGGATPAAERGYLRLAAERIRRGNLSERIRHVLRRIPAGGRRDAIRRIYTELADCTVRNTPWDG